MNLILLEPHELPDTAGGRVTLTGARARHVLDVLRASPGQALRVGLIDGGTGVATVLSIGGGGNGASENATGESSGSESGDSKNVDSDSSSSSGSGDSGSGGGNSRDSGDGVPTIELRCSLDTPAPPRPRVDLLLALPRPKVLRRLWPQLAALGVGRIILTNATRVERNYFDTHLLTEAVYRPLLVEGLQQARDTRLPLVSIHRRFRILIEDDLDALVPRTPDAARLVAHPGPDERPLPAVTLAQAPARVLLAIGPEGGWNAFELGLLAAHGFEQVDMGPRTLRTDTACIALLALLHDTLRRVPDRDAAAAHEPSTGTPSPASSAPSPRS